MEFTYRLTGTGWAEARVSDGSSSATITASYLEDASECYSKLSAMCSKARMRLGARGRKSQASIGVFERAGSDVHPRVLAFRDVYSREPDDKGVVIFDTRQPLRAMAVAIADGAQAVLDEYGEDEYLRRWVDHPFPLGHLEMIRAHLAAG